MAQIILIDQLPTTPTYTANAVKQFIVPVAAGKVPIENEDLTNLQEAPLAIVREIFGSVGNYFVINGAVTTSSNTTARTCVVSPGYVYLNGHIRYFPGYSGAYPFFVVNDTDVRTQKTFEDGNIKDVYVQRFAKSSATPGVGQAIRFDPSAEFRYQDMVISRSTTAINTLNTSVAALQAEIKVPIGGIIMWGDTLIPNGWALCDGQNGRPDLRARFVVGFDPASTDYATMGATGGAETVSLTADQNGPHNHTTNAQVFNSSVTFDGGSSGAKAVNWDSRSTGTVGSSGYGLPHENRPPFYTLAYIIRVL